MPAYTIDTTADQVAQDLAAQISSKTILITGVNANGLGGELARTIAKHNPTLLILAGRDATKVSEVKDTLVKGGSKIDVRVLVLNLACLAAVRKAAEEVLTYTKSIDAVVNNAGVMAVPEYTETKDGVELTFGVNYLGHWLLTNLLIPRIVAARGSVVNVTSDGHKRADSICLPNVNHDSGKSYNKWTAYAHSKAAMILFSVAIAQKLGKKGVRSFAVDPGVVLSTSLTRSIPQEEYKALGWVDEDGNLNTAYFTPVSPSQGVAGMIVGAFDPAIAGQSGSVIGESHVDNGFAAPYALDKETAEHLWRVSENLVGEEFSYSV